MWPPGNGESPGVESIRPESGKRDQTVKGNRYAIPLHGRPFGIGFGCDNKIYST
jgi:hypothetical protein